LARPANPDRLAAIAAGARYYEGTPCGRCGGTRRRVHNHECAGCNRHRKGAACTAIVTGARHRAARRGLKFELTPAHAAELLAAEGAACPACGATMRRRTRHAPSLDRVLNGQGYEAHNVAVICRRCNTAKGNFTSGELFRLAEWLRHAEIRALR
jgi:hypothetical protein